MSLLSNTDPIDSNNPLGQMERTTQNVHPGFFKSIELGLTSALNESDLGISHVLSKIQGAIPSMAGSLAARDTKQAPEALAELNQKQQTFDDIKSHEQGFSAAAGNFLGTALNPIFLAAGIATGGAADAGLTAGGSLLQDTLPAIVSKAGEKGLAGAALRVIPKAIRGGSFLAGGTLPQDVAENYDTNTDSIQWGGVAKNVGENFGVGMALEPIFPVVGTLLRKMGLRNIIDKESPTIDNSAVKDVEKDPGFSQSEKDFLQAYHKKAPTEELNTLAKQVIRENSPDALNEDGNMHVKLADATQLTTLNENLVSEMANDLPLPQKTPLSESITNSQLGETIGNPNVLDGLDGLIFHTDAQDKSFDSVLSATLKDVKRSTRELPEDTRSVSQAAIFKEATEGNYSGILPKNVEQKLRLVNEIKKQQKSINTRLPDRLRKRINVGIKKLENENDSIPLLKHGAELREIEENLFPKGELLSDYEKSPDYMRLLEMIRSKTKSLQARLLAAKIQITGDMNKAKGFREVAHKLKRMSQNPNLNFDKSTDAIEYARNTILQKQEKAPNISISDIETKATVEGKKVPEEEISKTDSFSTPEAAQLLEGANTLIRQANEMKAEKSVFDALNTCMKGKL